MPENKVRGQCPSCGARARATAKAFSKPIRCPKCGTHAQFKLVSSKEDKRGDTQELVAAAPPAGESKPTKKRKAKRKAGRKCASCQTAMAPGSVICISCGFNMDTGTHTYTDGSVHTRRRGDEEPNFWDRTAATLDSVEFSKMWYFSMIVGWLALRFCNTGEGREHSRRILGQGMWYFTCLAVVILGLAAFFILAAILPRAG